MLLRILRISYSYDTRYNIRYIKYEAYPYVSFDVLTRPAAPTIVSTKNLQVFECPSPGLLAAALCALTPTGCPMLALECCGCLLCDINLKFRVVLLKEVCTSFFEAQGLKMVCSFLRSASSEHLPLLLNGCALFRAGGVVTSRMGLRSTGTG